MSAWESWGTTRTVALTVLLSTFLPAPSQARQVSPGPVVRGVVTEAGSNLPLSTVLVSVRSGQEIAGAVLTDDSGSFLIRLARAGTYTVRAERVGYQTQEQGPYTLPPTGTFPVEFRLSPAPILLDSILVSVRRQGRTLGAGEQLVYGRLLDDENSQPIPQGTVHLVSRSGSEAATTLSNDDGLFWLVSPTAGTYRLRAERIGYRSSEGPEFRLMLGDTLGVDLYLAVEAVVLAPMIITATARPLLDRYDLSGMEGFFERYGRFSRSGYGEFMTRDSIAAYEGHATSTGHMMAMKFMSVREVLSGGGQYGQVILRGVTPPSGFGPPGVCVPTYFMDGAQIPREAVAEGQVNPIAMYPPEMLEGVEVYVQPNIPPEFLQGGFPCGVVALWTRRDPGGLGSGIPGWKKFLAGASLILLVLIFGR